MGTRLELNSLLESVIGLGKAHYQPPASYKLTYPCIVYERALDKDENADNITYMSKRKYTVTVIDRNPDTTYPDQIKQLRNTNKNLQCALTKCYVADNLYHYSFDIYF